jgi:hypothetical protein
MGAKVCSKYPNTSLSNDAASTALNSSNKEITIKVSTNLDISLSVTEKIPQVHVSEKHCLLFY